MSGIAGIIHFDGRPVEPGQVEAMTAAMHYRGPDGINHWREGNVVLGQCMLRTTPESLEETLPLTNENESLVLVMDGRVDNWEELRRDLLGKGAVLRTRADAELVLRAYEVWGRDCLSHIDGDFAFMVWDARRREAFCARDRMGHKPFHYHWNGNTFSFASELHPILALPWVPQLPNESMLAELLSDECYSRNETLWNGILRLVAAHRMVVGRHPPQPEQYWKPELWVDPPYKKDEEYFECYRELLTNSVRCAARSHQPVAIDVSGGLDSSAVFCMAEHLRRADRLPAPCIEGYTLAFTDESEANELAYARVVGEFLGVRIHEVPPSFMPLSWYSERARTYREFPGFPNASMFLDIRQQAALQGSRVALTGEGGDAWLQGSRAYYAEELAQLHGSALYDCFKTDAMTFGTWQAIKWLNRYGFFAQLPAAIQDCVRRLIRRMRGAETRDNFWLSPAMKEAIGHNRARSSSLHNLQFRSHGQRQLLWQLYDAFTAQIMERVERDGAYSGIEIRHPLNDPKLVQYAFSTPEKLRLRGDRSKYIHVQALQGLMPQSILERKSKADFSLVIRQDIDKMRGALMETLFPERASWLDPDGIAQLLRFYHDKPQATWPIWILWGIFGCNEVMVVP